MAQQHKTMMLASHEKHHHRKPAFQLIKQEDDKFFSKLLSKEAKAMESFRINDSLSGSVPFFWETRPGTPKHRFDDMSSMPPLTPPPSYFLKSSQADKQPSTPTRKLLSSKPNFLRVLFHKARWKKNSDSTDMIHESIPAELPDHYDDDYDALPVFPPLTPGAPTTLGMRIYGERRFTSQVSSSSSSTNSSMSDGDPGFDGSPTSTLYPGAMKPGIGRQRFGPTWPQKYM